MILLKIYVQHTMYIA